MCDVLSGWTCFVYIVIEIREQNNVTARLIDIVVTLVTSHWRHWNAC